MLCVFFVNFRLSKVVIFEFELGRTKQVVQVVEFYWSVLDWRASYQPHDFCLKRFYSLVSVGFFVTGIMRFIANHAIPLHVMKNRFRSPPFCLLLRWHRNLSVGCYYNRTCVYFGQGETHAFRSRPMIHKWVMAEFFFDDFFPLID